MNTSNIQTNKLTSWFKTTGYLIASIASLLFVNLETTAQTNDSLHATKDTITTQIPDTLQTKSWAIKDIKTYQTYEGSLGYKELIALYPSLKDSRVWKANFPNEPQPTEEIK